MVHPRAQVVWPDPVDVDTAAHPSPRRLELHPATHKLCDLEQTTALSGLQFSHLYNEVIIPALATSENSCEGQME